jgi:hypothetical protein
MTKYARADLSRVRTIALSRRKSKVTPGNFAAVFDPRRDRFSAFIEGLPRLLVAQDLRALVGDIINARRRGKPVLWMMGAHVIKAGLSPLIVDMIRKDVISAVAMNSAAAIHDVETAMWGETSEDVATNLRDGTFGMARETGEFINRTLTAAHRTGDLGYGEALALELHRRRARYLRYSVLAACYEHDIPITVHAAIGTDIVHQQPTMDGAATGELSHRDFRSLCHTCTRLVGGGVVLNVGSAVVMPEVFLKALTVARNLGARARGFTTAVFDMNIHYRPTQNVRLRPTQEGGKGYYFVGHHEIMIPLLAAWIAAAGRKGKSSWE